MPKVSIQQFRTLLTGRSDTGAVRVYRELARRPDLATSTKYSDWPIWSDNGGGGR